MHSRRRWSKLRFLLCDSLDDKETPQIERTPPDAAQDWAGLCAKHSNYRLEKQLGSGGMGAVYLATHQKMGRVVAIKVILGDLVADKQAIARFHQEVQSAARLSHRNVVTAYDADQVDDIHFLAMEYVEGESLAETIDRKGPYWQQATLSSAGQGRGVMIRKVSVALEKTVSALGRTSHPIRRRSSW